MIAHRPYRKPAKWMTRKWIAGTLALLLVAVCALGQSSKAANKPTGFEKLESALQGLNASMFKPGQTLDVIIQFKGDDKTKGKGWGWGLNNNKLTQQWLKVISKSAGTPKKGWRNMPAISARVNFVTLLLIAADPQVDRISIDWPVKKHLATTAVAIGANQVWNGAPGYTGSGVGVAVIDSGIANVPDLASRIIYQHSFASISGDQYGHGTHVAGIIAGTGQSSLPGSGYSAQYKGIAPGANLIDLQTLDGVGSGSTSDVLDALDWCIDNKDTANIRVINLSLGHSVYESYKTDPMCQAVEACVRNGMVVVVAAGNYGKNRSGTVYGGITSPGNDPAVITVGAVDTYDTVSRTDDAVASYSSRGPAVIDGLLKPDIVAPGNKIVSCANPNSYLYTNYPANQVFADPPGATAPYFKLSGTSMATPVVSGTVALMLEANPSLTPNMVKAILTYTAGRMRFTNLLAQGNGYLNTVGAVRLAAAVSPNFRSLAYGALMITNHSSVHPYDYVAGLRIPWGGAFLWGNGVVWGDSDGVVWGDGVLWGQDDGVIWGDGVLWGQDDGVVWGDSLMLYKAQALDDGVVWGDGVLNTTGVTLNGTLIIGAHVGARGVRSILKPKWFWLFANPSTLVGDSSTIIAYGEDGDAPDVTIGQPGDWYFPPDD